MLETRARDSLRADDETYRKAAALSDKVGIFDQARLG
jgi:hypothetical protein